MAEKIELEKLAQSIYWVAKKNYITHITSWFGFMALMELNKDFEKYSQQQILRTMKKGVEKGLFSKPYWIGTGFTPWAGSARRQRMWDLIDNG